MNEIICISCPSGCLLSVTGSGTGLNVSGNLCPAGIKYAKEELLNPTRNIATSVRVKGGHMPMLSVKTKTPLPKRAILDVVKAIHKLEISAPVSIGDVVLENALGTGVDIVATRHINAKIFI